MKSSFRFTLRPLVRGAGVREVKHDLMTGKFFEVDFEQSNWHGRLINVDQLGRLARERGYTEIDVVAGGRLRTWTVYDLMERRAIYLESLKPPPPPEFDDGPDETDELDEITTHHRVSLGRL